MSSRALTVILVGLVISLGGCSVASTATGAAATKVIAEVIAKDVIANAEEAGRNLIAQAEQSGSGLLSKAGNELNVATANAALHLEGVLDKSIDKLSDENRKILASIDRFREEVALSRVAAFELKDSASIDLRSILPESLFGPDVWFFLQRIDGIAALQGSGEHEVKFHGIGFGSEDGDRIRSRVKAVLLDGLPLSESDYEVRVDRAYETRLFLRSHVLDPKFDQARTRFVRLQVSVEVQRRRGSGAWRTRQFDVPVVIALYPLRAGEVVVSYTEPVPYWRQMPARVFSVQTPSHHQTRRPIRHFHYAASTRLPQNERFVEPRSFRIVQAGEGWKFLKVNSVDIEEDGRSLVLRYEMWG